MSDSVSYIVDDQDADIEYLCDVTHQEVIQSYYNNTWTTTASSDCQAGWFKYTFTGSRVRVRAGLARWGQNYRVKLDDGEYKIQTGQGEYDSGVLTPGEHTISYAVNSGNNLYPAFDFIAVTASEDTKMRGRTVITDDASGDVKYRGNGWSMSNLTVATFDYATGPYQESSHWTSTVGDSLEFAFTGDSVALYGINAAAMQPLGNITIEYAVDGGAAHTHRIGSDSTHTTIPMAQLLQVNGLSSTSHTLTMNVTDVVNAYPLAIDFIAYNATYDSISDMTGSASSSGRKHSSHIGAIVGGVLGGLVFVALAGLFLYVQNNRRRRRVQTRSSTIRQRFDPQLDAKVHVPTPSITVPRPVSSGTSPTSPTMQYPPDRKTGF
ncbi:hypothetical protein CYLTODRAFT_424727 [Cylindrobasidium torrendii FP15055 ss-10]|uniref:Transmembrane protein n=1 Tax=Cylindrobasidium torrendii FP15055 ss-10 TaxID=1314674 RepID=A0A0D7B3D1_9AGAR|nr:hypothetical protein CYLTODRAFT_424727 [Cylindrobasidium torrendii FP15055 ss-10]